MSNYKNYSPPSLPTGRQAVPTEGGAGRLSSPLRARGSPEPEAVEGGGEWRMFIKTKLTIFLSLC